MIRWLRRIVLTGLGLSVLWLAGTGLLVQRWGGTARTDLTAARQALLAQDIPKAQALLAAAAKAARRAHDATTDPVWWGCAHVPLLGRACAVTRGLTGTVDQLAREEIPTLLRVTETLRPARLVNNGVVDLAPIQAEVLDLRNVEARLGAAEAQVRRLPAGTGIWLIDRTRGKLLTQLSDVTKQVRQVRHAAELLPPMLGADGPRHYFVGFLTNAEARGLGGFLGAYGILAADHGRLHFTHIGPNTELKDATAPVLDMGPEYAARYHAAGSSTSWLESTVPTDFRDVAPVWLALWERQTGQHLDGAFATDPVALSYLLGATGPVVLPGGEVISSADVVKKVESDAYARFGGGDQTARKAYLVSVARAVVEQLLATHGNERAVVDALGVAAGEARVRVWSARAGEEAGLVDTALSGALPAPGHPVAGLVVDNGSANKLDYYLRRTVRYDAHGCGSRRRASIQVKLRLPVLPAGLPGYVTGRVDPLAGPHPVYGSTYLIVTLYVAGGATFDGATLDGVPLGLIPLPERGLLTLSTAVVLLPGQERVLDVALRDGAARGRVRTPVQPLVVPPVTTVTGRACGD